MFFHADSNPRPSVNWAWNHDLNHWMERRGRCMHAQRTKRLAASAYTIQTKGRRARSTRRDTFLFWKNQDRSRSGITGRSSFVTRCHLACRYNGAIQMRRACVIYTCTHMSTLSAVFFWLTEAPTSMLLATRYIIPRWTCNGFGAVNRKTMDEGTTVLLVRRTPVGHGICKIIVNRYRTPTVNIVSCMHVFIF